MNVISLLTPKTQVAYLYDDCTIRQGLEKLRIHGYTALPVLARDGSYAGTVSEGDLLWYIVDRGDSSLREKDRLTLKHLLRRDFNPAVSVRISMPQLLDHAMRYSFVPVVDDRGAFVGIVTRHTIIRRLALPNLPANPLEYAELSELTEQDAEEYLAVMMHPLEASGPLT